MATDALSVLIQSFDIQRDKDSDHQFASYALQVSRGGASWIVYRRYRQFVVLDSELRAAHLGVPRLPGKRFFGNLDHAFIQERALLLERYLNTVLAQFPEDHGLLSFVAADRAQEASSSDSGLAGFGWAFRTGGRGGLGGGGGAGIPILRAEGAAAAQGGPQGGPAGGMPCSLL